MLGYLRATSSGVPASTNLATTAAISESSLSAAWTDVTFTFTSGYNLTVGTQYALVVKPTASGLRLRYNANGTYTGGQRYYSSSGSSWTSSSAYDYYFKEYGTVTTTFVYDGDGKRVTQTVDGITTVYPNQYYAVAGSTATSNYYLGSKLIAVSLDGTLSYILQDHLGSTSTTLNTSGAIVATINYFSFGECRSSSGTLPTDQLFTGQRLDSTGLYYYGARYYDPTIGRFISPDTIVPDPANPQTLNRYAYCYNNPLKYTDPNGYAGEGLDSPAYDGALGWTVADGWLVGFNGKWSKISNSCADWIVKQRSGSTFQGNITSIFSNIITDQNSQIELILAHCLAYASSSKAETKFTLLPGLPPMTISEFLDFVGIVMPGKIPVPLQLSRGQYFERMVLSKRGLIKNYEKILGRIPDSLSGGKITEVKDVNYLYRTGQLKAFLRSGIKIDLVVSEQTVISEPLQREIIRYRGTITVRTSAGQYLPYVSK